MSWFDGISVDAQAAIDTASSYVKDVSDNIGITTPTYAHYDTQTWDHFTSKPSVQVLEFGEAFIKPSAATGTSSSYVDLTAYCSEYINLGAIGNYGHIAVYIASVMFFFSMMIMVIKRMRKSSSNNGHANNNSNYQYKRVVTVDQRIPSSSHSPDQSGGWKSWIHAIISKIAVISMFKHAAIWILEKILAITIKMIYAVRWVDSKMESFARSIAAKIDMLRAIPPYSRR